MKRRWFRSRAAGVFCVALAMCARITLAAWQGFGSPSCLGDGTSSSRIVPGDLNGDGHLDFVEGMRVWLGTGDGTFTRVADAPISGHAIGDFNGDGKPDLVDGYITCEAYHFSECIQWHGNIAVSPGRGDGTFAAPIITLVYLNSSVHDVIADIAVGDFNRDNKADLAIANGSRWYPGSWDHVGRVTVLLGKGDGTFDAAGGFSATDGPSSVTVVDYNGDGIADIAAAAYGGTSCPPPNPFYGPAPCWINGVVTIGVGRGDGTFSPILERSEIQTHPSSAAVADFDSDGNPDLAVAADDLDHNVGVILIFLTNLHSGATRYPFAFGSAKSITVADFDADGKADLVFENGGQISIMRGSGDGLFADPVSYAAGDSPGRPVIGDFNGDGRPDIAVNNAHGCDASILLNLGGVTGPDPATIVQHVGGTSGSAGTFMIGQAFTTPGGGPWASITFNFFSYEGRVPYAWGTAYLFTSPYSGSPSGLSSAGPLATSTRISGGKYIFPPSFTLQPNTQYFLYEDGFIEGAMVGFDSASGSWYQALAGSPFNARNGTTNFRVSGFVVAGGLSDLRITTGHIGTFMQGQSGATYSLTVNNVGSGPTAGGVTVTDTLPTGLVATSIGGNGWTCSLAALSCTRSDVLAGGASYPPITLAVSVSVGVLGTVTNRAAVSGGGELNTTNNSASDPTTILANPAIPTFGPVGLVLLALLLLMVALVVLRPS